MKLQTKVDSEILELSEQLKKFKTLSERVEDVQTISQSIASVSTNVIDEYTRVCDNTVHAIVKKAEEAKKSIANELGKAEKDRQETYSNFVKCKEQFDEVLKKYDIPSFLEELQMAKKLLMGLDVRLSKIEQKSVAIENKTADAKKGITNLSDTVVEGNDQLRTKLDGNQTTYVGEFQKLKDTTVESLEALSSQQEEDFSMLTNRLEESERTTRRLFLVCSAVLVAIAVLLKFLNMG